MPQARSGGSRRSGTSRSSSRSGTGRARSTTRSTSARSGGSSTAAKRTTTKRTTAKRTTAKRATTSRASSSRASSTRARAGAAEVRLEAAAQRLRKLNERIIEAGKEAGETTLANYEKALKTIAGTLERGPGSSDIEWISNLATAQAKFIRDVTASWTAAARKMLK
jgi:hypothetical protein